MTDRPRFLSLDEVAAEKQRLKELGRSHQQGLQRHWKALNDGEVRGRLLRNAAGEMLRSWKPFAMVSKFLGEGSFTTALGAAAFRKGGLAKRMVVFLGTWLLPGLLQEMGDVSLQQLLHELRVSLERLYARFHEKEPQGQQDRQA
ncbi:MAG: hypothetical protein H6595_03480 [Flavobacteriales bacterium]|nr:hypothetical protein [Flavobacteriales bacterium]MCB9166520.1 hypothetical protein [Flavobacteriales bacterium]MCB9170277.1 hypothetical protein [Flavobacteriales bacterium]